MFQFISANEERQMRFVGGGKHEHVPKLSVGGPEYVGDNKPLAVDDVIKSLGALYCSSNAGSGRSQDLRLVNLLFLRRPRRPHISRSTFQSSRGEGG